MSDAKRSEWKKITITPILPGSPEAVAAGCTCPVLDNGHGLGRGDGTFVFDGGCPIHGAESLRESAATECPRNENGVDDKILR